MRIFVLASNAIADPLASVIDRLPFAGRMALPTQDRSGATVETVTDRLHDVVEASGNEVRRHDSIDRLDRRSFGTLRTDPPVNEALVDCKVE